MPCKLRVQYPGGKYHVINRGDHQDSTFCDEDDRRLLVATLAEGRQETGFQIHSFSLIYSVCWGNTADFDEDASKR